jgi:hypothetical protein
LAFFEKDGAEGANETPGGITFTGLKKEAYPTLLPSGRFGPKLEN